MESEYSQLKRQDQIKSKFQKDFFEKHYYTDPMFRSIFEMLSRDSDPYEMIEILIKDRELLLDRVKELTFNQIIITGEITKPNFN